jgi:hypothetical protein
MFCHRSSCIGYRAVGGDRWWGRKPRYNASENREPEAAAARVCSPHAVFISMCPLGLNTGFPNTGRFPGAITIFPAAKPILSDTSAGYPEEQHRGKLRLSLSAQVPGTRRNRPATSRGDGQAAPVHRRVHGKQQRSGRHTKCFTLYELLFWSE